VVVAAAVVMAFPFGWGIGVLAAYVLAGPDFGQLPVATVPIGIIGAVVFALSPSLEARTRLGVMLGGSVIFIVVAWLVA